MRKWLVFVLLLGILVIRNPGRRSGRSQFKNRQYWTLVRIRSAEYAGDP